MPRDYMKIERQIDKCRAINIYENLYIDKYKENENIECLNGLIEHTFTPIYKFLNNNLAPSLSLNTHADLQPPKSHI